MPRLNIRNELNRRARKMISPHSSDASARAIPKTCAGALRNLLKQKRKPITTVAVAAFFLYSGLAAMRDVAQSLSISKFYEQWKLNTEKSPHVCGEWRNEYQVHAHYYRVLLLKRTPEVTAKASILENGPCLSLLLKSLYDAKVEIRAVIGENTADSRFVAIEIVEP